MSILYEDVVTKDNPLPVKDYTRKKVLWNTDTDFAKGTDTDTETSGTGQSAKLQLIENTDNDDDIPYTTGANYTPSDIAKIEADTNAKLKSLTGDTHNFPFTTPSNYTYDSGKVDVTGGNAQLKGVPYNAETTAYASYDSDIDLDIAGSTATGTAVGGASITGGKLNLTGGGVRYVSYTGVGNITSLQSGCIRFKYTPDYSGTPPAWYTMVELQHVDGSNYNEIYISHTSINQLYIQIRGSGAGIIGNYMGVWSVTSGVEYEIELNWDITAGETRLFVDGTQFGTTKTNTGTITQLNFFKVGSNFNATEKMDAYINDFTIFDTVQHTANYTPGESYYQLDNPTIVPNTGFVFNVALSTFTETATKPTGTATKHQLSIDGGTTWKWWSGSAWVTITGGQTDTWYYTNESNSATDINTNIGSIGTSGTIKTRSYLNTTDEQETPLLSNIYISENTAYSTDDNLYIDTKDASQIDPTTINSWLAATITNTLPTNTDIRVLFSTDNRVSWLTWSVSGWTAPTSATDRTDATSITDAQTNIASLPLGSGTLDVRLFLYTSDNSVTPDVSNINITSDAGFKTSGSWESDEYDSAQINQEWNKIAYVLTEIVGESGTVSARAGNITTVLGDYTVLLTGEETNFTGRYFQWKVSFTGNGTTTPNLLQLSIQYDNPIISEVSP